ncbi:conjugative transfer signal peptidase TraF [Rhizobium cremeum]|uniref:conjugative transfer signal peptidase TraF n=1 Tax=Rhizobium cremeum TaxID=2813827 RepID=UPI000DDA825F|nr:conjugative transfer signal peptidase TraF [Rhizobium cremeum]MCJ7997524.1 conjugative transfer signal peptidase TraF [Rhizobium cremeum]MCJ8002638.1 conjugative transfer signal peptidase TraF [Rhizobium cremeum]
MRRRGPILLLGMSIMVCAVMGVGAMVGGYRINLTPSEPLGLWRIELLRRPVKTGDLVFVCPPATTTFVEALRRGYLRRGLCAGGFAPLIKTVAARPGQHVEVTHHVIVDGRPIEASAVRKSDGEGRPLMPAPGGVVPSGYLFLHSFFASSYDSRYFGPVPAAGLLGLARPVLTFDL